MFTEKQVRDMARSLQEDGFFKAHLMLLEYADRLKAEEQPANRD